MLYSCVIALALAHVANHTNAHATNHTKLLSRGSYAWSHTPVDTNIIVKKDDYAKYDNCDDPGNCNAPCASPQIFHARMCDSWMCTQCPSDYCKESCAKLQEQYPTCRCHDWPDHKMTYSASDIPDVVLPTCKNAELVGCHVINFYYYKAMTACPEKLTFQDTTFYYYYDYVRTYFQGYYNPETQQYYIYQYYYVEYYANSVPAQFYYALMFNAGQSHDGILTYSEGSAGHAPGSPRGSDVHFKFSCDESPGVSYVTEAALGAANRVDNWYYSEDGSMVYSVEGTCAC